MSNVTTTVRRPNISIAAADTLTIFNLSAPTANTEVSQSLPSGTKQITIKVRDGTAKAQFSFVSGESGTKYITIPRGASYHIFDLNLTGESLYIQTNQASQTVEIIVAT